MGKVGVKYKKRDTCSSSSEMEPVESEDEVLAVRTAEFGPRPGDDTDDSGPVGVRFVEIMDPCILAESYVVSGWVEKRLGTVELVKLTWNGLMMIYCVSSTQKEWALQTRVMTCDRAPLKGVITGVILSVERSS